MNGALLLFIPAPQNEYMCGLTSIKTLGNKFTLCKVKSFSENDKFENSICKSKA
jgi:hypothetical protein